MGDDLYDLGHLVYALLSEESIGGACLHRLGLTMEVLASGAFGAPAAEAATLFLAEGSAGDDFDEKFQLSSSQQPAASLRPDWYLMLRDRASVIAKRSQEGPSVSSEHLVMAMTEVDGFVQQRLEQYGIKHSDVIQSLDRKESHVETLSVDLQLAIDDEPESAATSGTPAGNDIPTNWNPADGGDVAVSCLQGALGRDQRVHALLDANLNRAREGLRVLEDCARFVLCCVSTTERLKNVRHQLVEAEVRLRTRHPLIQRRDVESDAGTGLTTANEQRRSNLRDIITANCRRMQEAIRSLEEFGKLIDGQFSESCKQLRYQSYQAEQMLESRLALSESDQSTVQIPRNRSRTDRQQRLKTSHLYVLLTEEFCTLPWKQTAEAVLRAGTDILQLREKQLASGEIRRRAAWLNDLCLEHDALFFVNDDAELARDVGSDGVHVGQTDLPVHDARRILSEDQLVGLSTHNLSQLQGAVELDVDYVGVGPMFSTNTKSFEEYSGPTYAAEAAEHITLPWFAIGGIEEGNLSRLIEKGVRRIAVCGAVLAATSPAQAARQLKSRLLQAEAVD